MKTCETCRWLQKFQLTMETTMKPTDPEVAYLWLARRIADVFVKKHSDCDREYLINHALIALALMDRTLDQLRQIEATGPLPDSVGVDYITRLV